jgi:hypothetical protein
MASRNQRTKNLSCKAVYHCILENIYWLNNTTRMNHPTIQKRTLQSLYKLRRQRWFSVYMTTSPSPSRLLWNLSFRKFSTQNSSRIKDFQLHTFQC